VFCKLGQALAVATGLAALIWSSGCARRASAPYFQRLAVLRFENLGADPSADWIGRALSEMVTSELAGAPAIYALPSSRIHAYERVLGARPVGAPGVSAERGLALAAGANRLAYGEYSIRSGGILARMTTEDPQTGKMTAVVSYRGPAGDVVAAASALARSLWKDAPPYATRNTAALQAFVNALESFDRPSVEQTLERALAADPDFAPAYRLLAQWKAQRQDRAGALALLDQALARNLPPVERARLEVDSADLRGDAAARGRACADLARLSPGDPVAWRALAETAIAAHAYRNSVNAWEKSLDIEPQDVGALNQAGYAAAYAGDLPAATAFLTRYQSLAPADSNPLDSLGDVNLLAGRLHEAEGFYLQSARKNAHFDADGSLFKAAMARLMTGDIGGADALFQRYAQARAADRDPALDYRKAEWSWAAGRRRAACAGMEAFARGAENTPLRELAARGFAELTVWRLMLGDREAAAEAARKAGQCAGPSSAAIVRVTRFLTEPPATPAEWAVRAEREFPEPGQTPVRGFAMAYALLLARDFQPAGLTLKEIYNSGALADDEGLPVMLAWTYLEIGRNQEAAALLRFNPIPSSTGVGPFFGFYFPRLYALRAMLASHSGKADEARLNSQLFQKLSGPDPLVWEMK
jgi:tetratricopeptide (TPR) repeat protein